GTCQKQTDEFNAVTRTLMGKSNTTLVSNFPNLEFKIPSSTAQVAALSRKPSFAMAINCALGFPSKTSAEIAPDHRKLSPGTFRVPTQNNAQTSADIAVCLYWWYFHDALENSGNRFPLPAPAKEAKESAASWASSTHAMRLCSRRSGFFANTQPKM